MPAHGAYCRKGTGVSLAGLCVSCVQQQQHRMVAEQPLAQLSRACVILLATGQFLEGRA